MARQIPYRWAPLATKTSFRLLELLPGQESDQLACQIFPADINSPPNYEAVSYVCGSEDDKFDVVCGDATLKITRNLQTALSRFRNAITSRVLWADGICIDQNPKNKNERRQQIQLMGKIYENASQVLICVCNEDEINPQAFLRSCLAFLKVSGLSEEEKPRSVDVGKYYESESRKYETYRRRLNLPALGSAELQNLALFWTMPYFQRAWTFQECYLSKNRVFHFGLFNLPSDMLLRVLIGYLVVLMATDDTELQANDAQLAFFYLGSTKQDRLSKKARQTPFGCMYSLLKFRRGAKCKDPRDLVYSALSSTTDSFEFVPDYEKPVHLVFAEAVLHIIKSRCDFDVFRHVQISRNSSELPSWIPDWRFPMHEDSSHVFSRLEVPFHCSGSSNPICRMSEDGLRLTIRGTTYASVAAISSGAESSVEFIENYLKFKFGDSTTMLSTVESLDQAITRIMCSGLDIPNDREDQQWTESSSDKLDELNNATTESEREKMWGVFYKIAKNARSCRLIVTQNGKIGLGPEHAQCEDIIAILQGGRVPTLLRAKDDVFTLVGECYVDGDHEW